jgi:hypothetical protein
VLKPGNLKFLNALIGSKPYTYNPQICERVVFAPAVVFDVIRQPVSWPPIFWAGKHGPLITVGRAPASDYSASRRPRVFNGVYYWGPSSVGVGYLGMMNKHATHEGKSPVLRPSATSVSSGC